MKKSKRYKKWHRDQKFINKQNSLDIKDRIMGNAKENCYICKFAGYIFSENTLRFEPYCLNKSHMGRICNYSLSKWNDKYDIRESNYSAEVRVGG